MTKRVYIRDTNGDGAWYNASDYIDAWPLDLQQQASGEVATITFSMSSHRSGVAFGLTPLNGMEVMFYDHDGRGGAGQHIYYFAGYLGVRDRVPTPEGVQYELMGGGADRMLRTHIPHIDFSQTTYPNDSSRVTRLIDVATTSYGLPGTWDALSQVSSGGFVTYPTGSITPFHRRNVGQILDELRADPGQEGVDAGYPVPVREMYVHGEWVDPSSIPASGILWVLHYYSPLSVQQEIVPLTDRPDRMADYVADAFTRANSTTTMGSADTAQAWSSLVGTFGIDVGRAFLATGAGAGAHHVAVVASGIGTNGEVGVAFSVKQALQRLAFRVTSHPSEAYKWQGFIVQNEEDSGYSLHRYQAGVFTQLGSGYPVTPADGDVLKVVLAGSSITVKLNGATIITQTSTFNQTASLHGIGLQGTGAARWDAFSVRGVGALHSKLTQKLDPSNAINIQAIAGPGSDPVAVAWSAEVGASGAEDGSLTKTLTPPQWQAATHYDTGDVVQPTRKNGRHYTALISGNSGGVEPPWPLTEGASVTENALAVTDTFTRADNSVLGYTEDAPGIPWENYVTGAAWAIDAGKAKASANTGGTYFTLVESVVSRCEVQVTLSTAALGAMLAFNFTDENTGWLVKAVAASYQLYKRSGGVNTAVAAGVYAATPADGDVLKVRRAGSTISFYVGGVLGFTVSDAFNSTGKLHGLGANTGESGLLARFDAFTVNEYGNSAYQQWLAKTWDAGAVGEQPFTEDGGWVSTQVEQVWKVSDNFERPDDNSQIGQSGSGHDWTLAGVEVGVTVTWGIEAGAAKSLTTVEGFATVESAVSTCIVQVELPVATVGARLVARYTDAENCYILKAEAAAYTLYRRQGGGNTAIGTVAIAPLAGDVLKLVCEDQTLQFYHARAGLAPAYQFQATGQSFNEGATRHGVGITAGAEAARFNNFNVWQTYSMMAYGLTDAASVTTYTQINFGWLFKADRTVRVVESGTERAATQVNYVAGDQFLVEVRPRVVGNATVPVVKYYKRAEGAAQWVEQYTSTITPTISAASPMYAGGAIYHAGATLANVMMRRFTYGVYTDAASIDAYGPYPAPDVIEDETLDSEAKRRSRANAVFVRNPVQEIITCDTQQEYVAGRALLLNVTKFAWVNRRLVIPHVKPDWGSKKRANPTYHLTLGTRRREYGDDEPLGYLITGIPNENQGPPTPTGLTVGVGAQDTPTTVQQEFSWDLSTGGEQYIHMEVQRVAGPVIATMRFSAESNRGVVHGLPPNLPCIARIRAQGYNGRYSDMWSPGVNFTTAVISRPAAPAGLAQTANVYDEGAGEALVTFGWTPSTSFGVTEQRLHMHINGVGYSYSIPGNVTATYIIRMPGGATYTDGFVTAIDSLGQESNASLPSIGGTAADQLKFPVLQNPGFEVPNPGNYLLIHRWDLVTVGTGSGGPSTSEHKHGLRSARVTTAIVGDSAEYRSTYFEVLPPDEGQYVTFSYWAKTTVAGTTVKGRATFYDEGLVGIDSTPLYGVSTSTDWERYTFPVLLLPGYSYARIYLKHNGAAGSVYLDSVGMFVDPTFGFMQISEVSAPATPDTGKGRVYVKSGDQKLYFKNADGTEYDLTSPPVSVRSFGAVGDGTTNDQAAINSAITAAGVGGRVYFPPGTYKTNTQIQPLDSQWLMADGWNTKLKAGSTVTGQAIIGIYDVSRVRVSGIYFVGNGGVGGVVANASVPVKLGNSPDCVVEDCYMDNGSRWGLFVSNGSDRFTARNNLIDGISGNGIEINGSHEASIVHNTIRNSGNNNIELYKVTGAAGRLSRTNIEGNLIYGAGAAGINEVAGEDTRCIGNVIRDNGQFGIFSSYHDVDITTNSRDGTITGNTISGNGLYGVYFDGASGYTVSGGNHVFGNAQQGVLLNNAFRNVIADNHVYANGANGILLANAGALSNVLQANYVYNNSQSGAGNSHGIVVQGPNNIVIANICTDTQATKTQEIGLFLSGAAAVNNQVIANDLAANRGADFYDAPGSYTMYISKSSVNLPGNVIAQGYGVFGDSLGVSNDDGISANVDVRGPDTNYKELYLSDTTSGEQWILSHRLGANNNNLELFYHNGVGAYSQWAVVTTAGVVTLNNTLSVTGAISTSGVYKVGGTQVVGAQGAAVADATGAGDVVAQLNTLLARLRTHGLIS